MYIVSLNYHRPAEEIDALLEKHVIWLNSNFDKGIFIAAGRKDPRTGGIILVKDIARDVLDATLAEDPFVAVANYDITKMQVTRTSTLFTVLNGI